MGARSRPLPPTSPLSLSDGGGAESEDAEDWRPAHPAGDAVRPDGGGEDDDAYVSCESSSDDE